MTITSSSALADAVAAIEPCDRRHVAAAQRQLNSLTKPIGSLGDLEAIAAQMFSIFDGKIPLPLHRAVYVFAADHGVTDEEVSAYPREVTAQMVRNFLSGGAAINVLGDSIRPISPWSMWAWTRNSKTRPVCIERRCAVALAT